MVEDTRPEETTRLTDDQKLQIWVNGYLNALADALIERRGVSPEIAHLQARQATRGRLHDPIRRDRVLQQINAYLAEGDGR